MAARVRELMDDSSSPVMEFLDPGKIERFLKDPSDYGKPWYGQLMAGPQMLAYVLQIDFWLRKYQINVITK